MLTELSVKNFALIENLRLAVEPGFTVVSGETGAGKSLLVTAIGLLTGGKADSMLVRQGTSEAVIEAVFEVAPGHPVWEVLSALNLSSGDPLIIRRLISAEGRSRIHINDITVTLGLLTDTTSFLLDLAGQHSQQVLLDPKRHLTLLDDAASRLSCREARVLLQELENFSTAYAPYREAVSTLAKMRQQLATGRDRIDFLRFQVDEIRKANLKDPDEEEKLLLEKERIRHADTLAKLVSRVREATGHGGALAWLEILLPQANHSAGMDPTLDEGVKLLEEAVIPLREAVRFFEDYGRDLSVDPDRLDQIEARLYQLQRLRQKFGATLAEVMAHCASVSSELKTLDAGDEGIELLEKNTARLGVVVLEAQTALSQARQALARVVEKAVQKKLADLAMTGAQFEICITSSPALDETTAAGSDDVQFYLAANKGENKLPLIQCASGGELSRIMLALKTVLGTGRHPMTCLFDEIDAGIGGAAADCVGSELKLMARNNQVLVVTHLPQIAAYANHHYVIEKTTEGSRTRTALRQLGDGSERETEVARMLGGMAESRMAKAHARELLDKGTKSLQEFS